MVVGENVMGKVRENFHTARRLEKDDYDDFMDKMEKRKLRW